MLCISHALQLKQHGEHTFLSSFLYLQWKYMMTTFSPFYGRVCVCVCVLLSWEDREEPVGKR